MLPRAIGLSPFSPEPQFTMRPNDIRATGTFPLAGKEQRDACPIDIQYLHSCAVYSDRTSGAQIHAGRARCMWLFRRDVPAGVAAVVRTRVSVRSHRAQSTRGAFRLVAAFGVPE